MKTHKPTQFCIAFWFRFVCLFWHSFLTKFPIVNIVVLTIFLICIRWDMNVEIWYIVLVRNGGCWSIAGKELWVNAWYVVIKTFHIPRPLPLPVIHYKQRKKVKYKSQILKTSIFQFFKKQVTTPRVFNVLQTFHICSSFSLQCRFWEIWLIWRFHQSSDVTTHFM